MTSPGRKSWVAYASLHQAPEGRNKTSPGPKAWVTYALLLIKPRRGGTKLAQAARPG